MPHTTSLTRVFPIAVTSFFTALALTAQVPPTPPPAAAPADEAVLLSPFQVDATADKGYLATQTLSGTRLKTDLRDIGSALTIFTEQMMNDLGANSINDLLAFAPNTDPFVNSLTDTSGNGNNFINNATQYVTRGGSTTVVGQDFFSNGIPTDRFNSEAFTFTRGPNAILFGLGNPAGAFVSSTKRAKNRTETTVEVKTDDRDSFRTTFDHNQVIKKDLLALRYTGLYDRTRGFRTPSESLQRRHFVTARFTPFKKTAIRANYEQGNLNMPATRPWPVYDAVSPWLAAGGQLLPIFNNTAAKPAGSGISNYTLPGVVSTEFSTAGVQIPSMRWVNAGQSTIADYANGYPASSAKRSLLNPALYPVFASSHGSVSFRKTDYKIYSFFLEQQLTRDLFVEAAVNRVFSDIFAVNGFEGGRDTLYVDVNQQLPTGAPNPNVGKLYTESQSTLIVAPSTSLSKRAMASYELDLSRQPSKWLRYLGRHRAAVFVEEVRNRGNSTNNGVYNTTPLVTTGASGQVINAANQMFFRYYYDPASGNVGNTGGQFDRYSVVYANAPLPSPDASGVTPAYINQQGPNMADSTVTTRAVAVQSSFLNNRIILTNGIRRDNQRAWRAVPNDFLALRDARGIFPDPRGYNVRTFLPNSLRERDGATSTHGAVFHATHWLSFTYNTSNNFQANDSSRNVYGELLPNPQGKGSDYGLKLTLLDRRLFFDLTYYTNAAKDKIDSVASTPAGDFKGNLDALWTGIANLTGDQKYNLNPYSSINTVWNDSATTSSKGWEFSATANPTPQWRLTVNGSKRSTGTTSARGAAIRQYLAEYLPIIKANAQWMAATTANAIPVSTRVATIETTLANFSAIQSLPEDIYAPSWSVNMIQTYTFAPGSRLAGVSLGGSMNARGKTINGFAETANNVLNPNQPYYAPTNELFGAWITYQRKLLRNRLDWRVQLNVRNLFDAYTVFPLRTVDARDGTHRGAKVIYRLSEPRTYTLTSTFKF
jgi:outer membrane receptor for ferric coprogen and ferric-rhodotorulic acid